MTETIVQKARGYLVEWQVRLHLQDWSVKVRLGEVSRDERIGESRTNWRDMTAVIVIPADYESRLRGADDILRYVDLDRELEATIVHELLHIAWSPRISDLRDVVHETLGEGGRAPILSALDKAEEFAVNFMTRALLTQKYPPRGDEKSSESTYLLHFEHPDCSCPDCTHQHNPTRRSIPYLPKP